MVRRAMILVLLVLGCLAAPTAGPAAEEGKYEFRAQATMKNVLLENVGKRVIVKFGNGETMEGTITSVGDSLVHVARLTGKDFYDAVVRIDGISAVIFKVRNK